MTGSIREEKYLIYFILSILTWCACLCVSFGIEGFVKERRIVKAYSVQTAAITEETTYNELEFSLIEQTEIVYNTYTSSEERIVEYDTLSYDGAAVFLSADDYEVLCRIVQAEAGCEDMVGRILVANVVLNRVRDERFPDTVREVVFQYSGSTAQFSPVADGSYARVVVTEETKEAVERAIHGEDYSEGALYFAARRAAGIEKMRWFDRYLTSLFTYGGHEFFL